MVYGRQWSSLASIFLVGFRQCCTTIRFQRCGWAPSRFDKFRALLIEFYKICVTTSGDIKRAIKIVDEKGVKDKISEKLQNTLRWVLNFSHPFVDFGCRVLLWLASRSKSDDPEWNPTRSKPLWRCMSRHVFGYPKLLHLHVVPHADI